MRLKGAVEYYTNGNLKEPIHLKFEVDTGQKAVGVGHDICDAISFALYGKLVFRDSFDSERGFPLVILHIDCKGKKALVIRQAECYRVSPSGIKFFSGPILSVKAGDVDSDKLSSEEYDILMQNYLDLSYDEFSAFCHVN